MLEHPLQLKNGRSLTSPSIFFTTAASSVNKPDINTLTPIDLPFIVTTQLDQLQADEPLQDTTSTADAITLSPPTTPCWTRQISGLRAAVGLSLGLSLLLALGLVYVFFLYHRLKHGSRDAETGNISLYFTNKNSL